MQLKNSFLHSSASVWMVMGMAAIMTLLVVALAVFNYNREVRDMEKVLGEKGTALIRSFEAGAKVGMMGDLGSEDRLQALIDATAELPDILYIVLTDNDGMILAHSDSTQIGSVYLDTDRIKTLAPERQARWMIENEDGEAASFVVYKEFVSLGPRGYGVMRGMMGRHMRGMRGHNSTHTPGWGRMRGTTSGETIEKPLIFIGLDVAPFVEARQTDMRVLILTSGVLLLVGLGGMVSLFWLQAYRRSRQQLKDSQAFSAEIVANLPIGLVVTRSDNAITHINADASTLLGIQAEDALNRPVDKVLPPAVIELASGPNRENTPVTRELLVRTEKTEFPANVGVAPVLADKGAPLGTIFILSDLTEIHRLQADVKQREKMAAIGNLAAGIAHEVRNPLSSIKGYATYFAGLFDEGSENRKAATVMITETERLNRVISELLDFSRPSDFKFRETDMTMVMDTVSRLLQQDVTSRGIDLTIEVEPELPMAKLDADRMIQALLNAGINGVQAMDSDDRLSLRAYRSDTGLNIEIADTGQGIPEEDLSTIFDPYFTTKSQGTGLGLAVVRKIVEGHGGNVEVESITGKGTTFTISLPQAFQENK
ncbi:ATP-binding protein [Pseudodesulfovibrio sediminis]|uniref:histidine kinase n=1 Tax=Pseudodesulfovibrio sediminis TaxID=2810563 RepID=A0ABM8I3Z8_9BACT|nr:ATP-binding protein [Pseudodesulfovibrio sediminis]BCS87490.1 hypothetical protein PSDVSF_07320 [Pseudodesulfovibrio sediminis]